LKESKEDAKIREQA
jgi:hypothetical protein